MADKKISALTGATTPLAGSEVLPIVQGGSTVKVSVDNLTAGKTVTTGDVISVKTSSAAVTDVITVQNLASAAGTEAGIFFSPTSATGNIRGARITGINDGSNVIGLKFYTGTGAAITSKFEMTADGNLAVSTAGKGIDFSANTHAAGMTSELLDWYEEGTWTAGVSFGGGSTGVTYANNAGYYTRIGNIVTVSCYLVLSNKGSSTGAARITGLPFTCVNNAAGYSALSVLPLNVTFTGQLSGYANINDTTIDLVPSTGVALTDVGFANNSTFIISLTYRAA